ncbi:MAG: hypothetical protein WBC22_13995 [Sedimentisphaerales bacterium]
MNNSIDDIRKELDSFTAKISANTYNDLLREFRQLLDKMARNRLIDLGNDVGLEGSRLEIRVRLLFEHAGMKVEDGRPSMEDFVIKPPKKSEFYLSLVIEVKSKSKQSPEMDHLRQLDDWVFDLSGEHGVRKRGYKLWNKHSSKISGVSIGAWQPPHIHPKRYKGVFIFNGPIGMPFENRSTDWLEDNQEKFVKDRGFCMISLESLISWAEACHDNDERLNLFWKKIYETNGILQPYSVEVDK